jgi:hypothetical protein
VQIAVALSTDAVVWKPIETGFALVALGVLNTSDLDGIRHQAFL